MKLEAGRYYKALVSINAMRDSMEDVTEQFGQFSTFPTWQEFNEWAYPKSLSTRQIYEWFQDRIQPLEIGREYEVSDDGEVWTRDTFGGYLGKADDWNHIRPIQQTPKQDVLERLKKIRDWHKKEYTPCPFTPDEYDEVIADAIKTLEESK